jgi:ribosomal protein L24E
MNPQTANCHHCGKQFTPTVPVRSDDEVVFCWNRDCRQAKDEYHNPGMRKKGCRK